jgi:hypothetical protein
MDAFWPLGNVARAGVRRGRVVLRRLHQIPVGVLSAEEIVTTKNATITYPPQPQGSGHPGLVLIIPQKRQDVTGAFSTASQGMKPPALVAVTAPETCALLRGRIGSHLDNTASQAIAGAAAVSSEGADCNKIIHQRVQDEEVEVEALVLAEILKGGSS